MKISIHLMLLLNCESWVPDTAEYGISIHLMLLLNQRKRKKIKMDTYFNTSYVVIKPNLYIRLGEEIKHFNTSYVVIKHKLFILPLFSFFYFNTSYVVIKLYIICFAAIPIFISIHLMLLLNNRYSSYENYILQFQYILCCY